MRRRFSWLVLWLVAILPLQLSWAAVAGYCGHEATTGAAPHFGHHEHEHQQADQQADQQGHQVGSGTEDEAESQAATLEKAPLSIDDDCALCHLGHAPALPAPCSPGLPPSAAVSFGVQGTLHPSHIPDVPERPDIRLA